MTASCPLGRCDGSGWIDDEEARGVRECTCRPQIVATRRSRSLSAVIPRRYQGVSFDRPPVTAMPHDAVDVVRRYVRRLDQHLDEGKGLWLVGDVGTGKTTLAMIVSREALDRGRTVAIYSLPRLLAEIRSTFDDDTPGSYSDLLERLAEVDLLHIDDFGAEKTSPWVLEQLYTIVNDRYEAQRAITLTTNLDRDALADQVGARTVSRLDEMCDMLPLFGSDRRFEGALGEHDSAPADHAEWHASHPRLA